ncbi:MAG TPA: phosphoribosyl-ATP diphosphatase [Xanthobacteraceae bacterium]|jgi:phosphoribosyl-ATP pyrophosphohydrolase|nr:phosphoribosyl-ATP diphosphatase [Xanthobacteraceae bacterium]
MTKYLARSYSTASDPLPTDLAGTCDSPSTGCSPPRGVDRQAPRAASGDNCGELELLFAALDCITPERSPRTFKLAQSSRRKISQKVIEEAGEVALEAVRHHASGVVRESADLLYHLVVLWHRLGIEPGEIWAEMRTRADAFGIAEKLPKTVSRHAVAADLNRSIHKSPKG